MSQAPNHRLHRTLNQRRFACWFRAGEADRWASQSNNSDGERVMKRILSYAAAALAFVLLVCTGANAGAQAAWRTDTRSTTGPIAQVSLPDAGNKRRTAFIAFEFARSCDPIFSFAEITGSRLGAPVSQSILKDSKIGVLLNGTFHTWHAAITKYDNGYEAGFGVTNELLLQFLVNLDSLAYVTPVGERVPLPTAGFREAVQAAIDVCRRRVK
jgi:hypothetical protein